MTTFWSIQTFNQKQVTEAALQVYNGVLPYVQSFLTSQHPYRNGTMCPFVPKALKHDRIFFSTSATEDTARGHKEKIIECIEFFKTQSSVTEILGSVIILFPKDYEIGRLLEIHRDNRMLCVKHGLMLGALYPTNQAPSLHNKEYYPSRTPTPTLVIRNMVPNDLVFLDPSIESNENKLAFLNVFLVTFAKNEGTATKKHVIEAKNLQQKYAKKICRTRILELTTLICCSVLAFALFYLAIS